MLPTLRQGRKVIWEGIDGDGKRARDAWPGWERPGSPEGLVRHIRHDEMKVELFNGSIWYVVGSDNYDALMGTNPVGVVFSEWALTDPNAWEYVRPILAENGGWAVFVFTPRGRNHGHAMYEMAQSTTDWFAELLTVEHTKAISREAIENDRRSGMANEIIQQEYWCSFDAPLHGAYYADQIAAADQEGRIASVPHDPAVKVDTWWDLGHSDATAIWWAQAVGGELHIIDYYEANGQPLEHFAAILKSRLDERKLVYGRHLWPHDGGAKTLASGGRPLSALFADLGVPVEVQVRHDVEVGIQRARQVIPRCWFDRVRCRIGLEALRSYRKDIDEDRSTVARVFFKPVPRHDWASHAADAFRTGAMASQDARSARLPKPKDRYAGDPVRPSSWTA
mgnify:CR=1 FL=1